MTNPIERTIDLMIGRGPIPAINRSRHRDDLVVLAYHGVDDRALFARHLDHLTRHFSVVGLDQVLGALSGAELPPSPVLITFDDGERTVLTAGLPELAQRDLPAVLFAVPGVLDSETPFWWVEAASLVEAGATTEHALGATSPAQVVRTLKHVANNIRLEALEQLRGTAARGAVTTPQLTSDELVMLDRAGIRVENHSWSHPLLDHCSEAEIAQEIGDAADRLAALLGRPSTVFAYPNGNVDGRVAAELSRVGVEAAFLFDHHLSPIPPADPLHISRVRVNSTTSMNRFVAITSGVHSAVHAMRGGT